MKNIVLPLIVIVVCLVNDTATQAISAATNLPLAAVLAGNISGRSSAQPGDTMMRRPDQLRTLTFEERVMYQRAIEEVYWRHRIWPKERADAKPALDAVMTHAQLEGKVTEYERNSQALEDHWHRPITAEQLQAEMDRMAQNTKQPEVLQELFEALGNDPFVIAECLARPLLAERLLMKSDTSDRTIHTQLAQIKKIDQKADNSIDEMKQFGGKDEPQKSTWGGRGKQKVVGSASATYALPSISHSDAASECTDNTWTSTATSNAPSARGGHTAIWTGSEMIVWGGSDSTNLWDTGGRYNPSTDAWRATSSTNAPSARSDHTAVWTGTEMIVWGGNSYAGNLNTGGRYNPATNTWMPTSTTNAPSARFGHTAVWTGSEMIVWGSYDYVNTGGRYNPGTDSWVSTSTINAPSARHFFSAVWTGSEMIIWGGSTPSITFLNTGRRYNPNMDTWTATSTANAPSGREVHAAIWTSSEMIIWAVATAPT